MKFELSKVEENNYNTWWQEHKKVCPDYDKTNMGVRTFCFSPLGFGTVIRVNCSCGESIDITDDGEGW